MGPDARAFASQMNRRGGLHDARRDGEDPSGVVLAACGAHLIGLAAVTVAGPSRSEPFRAAFGSLARAHYPDLGLRLRLGEAVLRFAAGAWLTGIFRSFGRVLVVMAVALPVTPGRWRHRFARRAIGPTLRHIRWSAAGAFGSGICVHCGPTRLGSG